MENIVLRLAKRLSLYVALFVLGITGCAKLPESLLPPPEPTLRVVSISPTNLQEYSQAVEIILEYEDGDGDLGESDPDATPLYVKDSRLPEADKYHVQPLAPDGKTVAIKGQIKVTLPSVFVLGNATSEQAYYTVKIRDRAGNWSPESVSPTITIRK